MNVLVFGKSGQVATELAKFDGVTCLDREQCNLSDPAACEAVITGTNADAVINAAAYTAVDRAESDRETAMIVNAMAPTAMAATAAQRNIPFLHISSDYVFDGKGDTPFKTDSPTNPLSIYGASKLGGERGVIAAGGACAVLRTSWVFSAHGANFVKTMLRLSADQPNLNIVADQIGGPTPADDIAAACMQIVAVLKADPNAAGIYHFSGKTDVSWAEFAVEIFAQARRATTVTPITTAAYPTPATRPLNSRLDCQTTSLVFNLERPDWRNGLCRVLTDLNVT